MMPVEEFWKYVNIWRRYEQMFGGTDTEASSCFVRDWILHSISNRQLGWLDGTGCSKNNPLETYKSLYDSGIV